MKKITRILVISSILALLAICMTSVSFAGTKNDKVTVTFLCASPTSTEVCYSDLVVTGDLAEKYCANQIPESIENEPDKGVSYLDVLVAACRKKYNGNVDDYLKLGDARSYTWILSAFEGKVQGCIVNNYAIDGDAAIHKTKIKNGDTVILLIVFDGDFYRLFTTFDKVTYTSYVGKPITVTVKGMSIMNHNMYDLDTVTLRKIDMSTGATEIFTDAVYDSGKFTFSFDKVGTYFISADGKTTYKEDNNVNHEDEDVYGGLARVIIEEKAPPKPVVPAKPVIKTVKRNSKTKGTVKWGKAKNAKKYEVAYRIKNKSAWTTKKVSGTSVTLKLKAKKAYQVKVRSINGTSCSAYSGVKTIKAK